MLCLYCGKPAEHTEDYDSIPIGTCPDGHRTGKDIREAIAKRDGYEFLMADWAEADRRAIELFKKAS